MPLSPQKLREATFLILFSQEHEKSSTDSLQKLICEQLQISKKSYFEAFEKSVHIASTFEELDHTIQEANRDTDFSKLSTIERTAVRLAAFEMLRDEDIPPKVAIAEALRLAKKFSYTPTVHFINVLLDALYKHSNPPH